MNRIMIYTSIDERNKTVHLIDQTSNRVVHVFPIRENYDVSDEVSLGRAIIRIMTQEEK
jgi:hypothetical protein